MFIHLRHLLLGFVSLVLGLSIASYFISVLYVLSHFDGTAQLEESSIPVKQRCALVFGSAIKKGGEPGPAIVRRVSAAVKLYDAGKAGTLIMSGGRGPARMTRSGGVENILSEASVMAAQAQSEGVPVGDILLEEKSTSTLENIKFTQDVMRTRCTSVLAVSDRYHLARIKLLAGRLDVPLETYPAVAAQNPLLEFRKIMREGAAILYYLPFLVSRF